MALPSKRLVGDYLAIVTLFFLQIFNTAMLNGDAGGVEELFGWLGLDRDLTGGPNGILNIDPFSFFGHELDVSRDGIFSVTYMYVGLAMFAVVYVLLRLVNYSRTGRAWRSLREDPLAAELMGMPVGSLKLLAFAFGAAVAALTGTLFAALNGSVFPQTFSFALLITLYTMVILGGVGNQVGVVLGAIFVSVMLELLREPSDSRVLFYAVVASACSPSSVSPSSSPWSSAGLSRSASWRTQSRPPSTTRGSTGRSATRAAGLPTGPRSG